MCTRSIQCTHCKLFLGDSSLNITLPANVNSGKIVYNISSIEDNLPTFIFTRLCLNDTICTDVTDSSDDSVDGVDGPDGTNITVAIGKNSQTVISKLPN